MSEQKSEESGENDFFSCQQCGYCCQGETTVSLDKNDQERLQKHLDIEFDLIKEKYLRDTDGVIQMKTIDGHCIFFENGCSIHAGKPWRCTQWPLHPSILDDSFNYETIMESCPGINRDLSYEEFCRLFKSMLHKRLEKE